MIALQGGRLLVKAKRAGDNEIRHRKNGWWQKVGPRKWKRVPGLGPVHAKMSLAQVEHALAIYSRSHSHEIAVAFTATGGQLFRVAGGTEALGVDIPEARKKEARENGNVILTHNHPGGSILSPGDVVAAIEMNLAAVRCVGPDGTGWEVRRPQQGWGPARRRLKRVREAIEAAFSAASIDILNQVDVWAQGQNPVPTKEFQRAVFEYNRSRAVAEAYALVAGAAAGVPIEARRIGPSGGVSKAASHGSDDFRRGHGLTQGGRAHVGRWSSGSRPVRRLSKGGAVPPILLAAVSSEVQAHHDALAVQLLGAESSGLTPDRVAALLASGHLLTGDMAGLHVPGMHHRVDPWLFALLMGVLMARAGGDHERVVEMRKWPLDRWKDAVDEHINERLEAQSSDEPASALPLPRPSTSAATTPPASLPPPPRPEPQAAATATTPEPQAPTAAPDRDPEPAGAEPVPPSPPTPPPPTPPSPPGGGDEPPPGPPIPAPPDYLTPVEREAWIQARTRGGEFARGLGNKVDAQMQTEVAEVWEGEDLETEVDADKRAERLEIIREEVADAIAHGRSAKELAGRLGDRTGDWARDWLRIARTELQGAHNEGVLIDAVRFEGPDAQIARVPEAGACAHCRRLFVTPEGAPRIFTAAQLVDNGTNVGRSAEDWKPTVWPIHPNCECGTVNVPKGMMFDAQWRLVRRGAR